ncbi:MAG: heavy metal efflux pump, cobalt-zinc-cadmium [Chthoniobacteraceae bacterium]|nr:heavy metal efflux pump, cobalt-zinc-cadmium [Chthoniobacteraceae bacterium]
MLSSIVRVSLRHRGIVMVLAVALLVWGSYVASRAPLDVFPEFVQPQVTIQTEAPGLSAEQVEVLVTRPVESSINGAAALDSVRSESIQGLSVVTAVFKENTNIYTARQAMAEKLGTLTRQLPDGVRAPTLSPLTSSTMDLLKIGLVSKTMSGRDLRTFVDWTLKPRLLAVSGVAHANVFGGEIEQLQVQVSPEKLAAFDLTLTDILESAKAATGVRGAGFIDTPAQRIVIQSQGQMFTPEELGEVVVRKGAPVVRMRDVATVKLGSEPKFGDTLIMGGPGVLITMSSQYGANTLTVTHALEEALAELNPIFQSRGIKLYPRLHRPATFIETALGNVQSSLIIGGALVGIVLLLFLLDLRIAFISFVSIPLSLLTAVLILDWWGVSLNTMTLGGFAVAIGVVVDDAIIDVENILRRLRENAALAAPRPLWRVVLEASVEVRTAVVYATLIVAVVFMPVLTMSGLQGRFFGPLGVAFILSILASLGVALTVTPAMCLVFLGHAKAHEEPGWIRALKVIHRDWLLFFVRWPIATALGAVLLVAGSCALTPFFGGELLPEFREGHFVLGVKARPGMSIEESLRVGKQLSKLMLANEHISTVEQQVGRAESGEDTWGPNQSEFHVELKRGTTPAEEVEVQAFLRDMLKDFPGIQSEVLTFLGDRIGETISGETASVVVSVFGENLDQLDATARLVSKELSAVPGNADVQVKAPPGAPVLSVNLRPERLTQFGFRPLEVLDAIETAFQGTDVAQMVSGNRIHELAVILVDEARRDPETVGDLLLSNGDGLRMPLRQLADVELTNGRPIIEHDGARRRQTVTCNVEKRDVTSFVAEARKRVTEKVKIPGGVYLEWTGAAEEQKRARAELAIHFSLAVLGIILLLSLVFNKMSHVALVLANIPFALVGGVLAVFASGGSTSIGSWVGFVTLFGISTRNSIMLISHYEHLVGVEGAPWSLETVARGAGERLVPILMTALVTALGVLPLAMGSGEAGREIEGPMAIVILGGLITSTALNLIVLPALAWRWGRFDASQADENEP